MRISKIELCNFGSYAGVNVFDLGKETSKKRIVLIGGKNGAGKTTLFSGIKLCLYGHKAEGYNGVNSFYRKEVKKFFNDIGKYETDFKCYFKVDCFLSNGQNEDFYEIKREWNAKARTLNEFEHVLIKKNGQLLNDEELSDFDNYLLTLIPPELFNLFFFDGEQIADYFLSEGENQRIKRAFMVLCGFDNLDIMEKNFRRILFNGKKSDGALKSSYLSIKDNVASLQEELKKNENRLNETICNIEQIDYEISILEKKYKLSGGVSYEEWSEKLAALKKEELLREEKKGFLKKMANEAIPFIIIHDRLLKLLNQAEAEREKQQLEILQSSLRELLPDIMKRVYRRLEWMDDDEITQFVLEEFDIEVDKKQVGDINYILNLSGKEFSSLQNLVNQCISYDKSEIIIAEREIKESLKRTQKIREYLDKSSIDGLQAHLEEKNALSEKKRNLTESIEKQTSNVEMLRKELIEKQAELKREEKKFEDELKQQSVQSLSEKAIAFLEELQNQLFCNKIQEVQRLFMKKIKILARKNNFIDEIIIDKDFGVHIFKRVDFNTLTVCSRIKEIGYSLYAEEYGTLHCNAILESTNTNSLEEFVNQYSEVSEDFSILQEIEKSRLSKGEKQVFIMALYWAFMRLSKYEVPFIIDTPFARIDSEHRRNITKNFFMDLRGQVFIFSTNEEITMEHYQLMEKQIQAKFLLENSDNICTTVLSDSYFGGESSAV